MAYAIHTVREALVTEEMIEDKRLDLEQAEEALWESHEAGVHSDEHLRRLARNVVILDGEYAAIVARYQRAAGDSAAGTGRRHPAIGERMTADEMATLLNRLSAFSADMAALGMHVTTEVLFPDPAEDRFEVVNINIVVRPDTDDKEATTDAPIR